MVTCKYCGQPGHLPRDEAQNFVFVKRVAEGFSLSLSSGTGHRDTNCNVRNGPTPLQHKGVPKAKSKSRPTVKRLICDIEGGDGSLIFPVSKRQTSMVRGPKNCTKCKQPISWRERETHEEVCPEVEISCKHGCGLSLPRGTVVSVLDSATDSPSVFSQGK